MLAMSGAAYSHAFISQVVVGSQEELFKSNDVNYPAVVFDFPIQGNITSPMKQYSIAFEVHDRLIGDNSNMPDKLIRAGKVENIAEDVYHLVRSAIQLIGFRLDEPNEINFLIDLPEGKDMTVMARFEFNIRQTRRNCDPIPTR